MDKDYVGVCPECGRALIWCSAKAPPSELAKDVAKIVKSGLDLQRLTTEEARKIIGVHQETCRYKPAPKKRRRF